MYLFERTMMPVLAIGLCAVSACTVAEQIAPADLKSGILAPEVETLKEVSKIVAVAVGEAAIKKGVSGLCVYSTFQHDNNVERLTELIDKMHWQPSYLPLVPM